MSDKPIKKQCGTCQYGHKTNDGLETDRMCGVIGATYDWWECGCEGDYYRKRYYSRNRKK